MQDAEAGCSSSGWWSEPFPAVFRLISALVVAVSLSGCTDSLESPPIDGAGALSPQQPEMAALGDESNPISSEIDDATVEVTRQDWDFAHFKGVMMATPHYRIYTTIDHEHLVDHLPYFYEAALEHYTTALTDLPPPRRPLESFIFRTRTEWKAKTQQMLPDQYGTFEHLGRGGFTTRGTAVLYYIDSAGRSRDTLSIAAHEGWHQYAQASFRNPLPVWLEEGMATYMETFRLGEDGKTRFMPNYNRERRNALRDAQYRDRLIDLDELLTNSPQELLQKKGKESLLIYYAQVWALARFLADGEDGVYRESLGEVLKDAARGRLTGRLLKSEAVPASQRRRDVANRVGKAVVLEYFNPDWDEFESQYDGYVKEIAGGYGRRGSRRGGR